MTDLRNRVSDALPHASGHLCSFEDGFLYKSHPVFSKGHAALQLVIYSDEFEVLSPLGPHKKKHKITALYFLILNAS